MPAQNILLGEGRGFEIAQGRLGPGRIHHCMRLIGVAERALEMHVQARASSASPSARRVSEQGVTLERIAESRILIDQARWLVLNAAYMMDTVGNRAAKKEIAMIKVAAPDMACRVIDWAIQVHGGGGVSDDFPLAAAYAAARTLRFADGPDEVHREQIGKLELARYRREALTGSVMADRHFKFWPAHAMHHLVAPATNLFYNAEVSARRYPDKPFLVFYDTAVTFARIPGRSRARRRAFSSSDCGVRKGDRVLLLMQNSPQFVIGYYGILRANAVVVPLNPMNLTQEILRYAAGCGSERPLIVSQELYPRDRAAARRVGPENR